MYMYSQYYFSQNTADSITRATLRLVACGKATMRSEPTMLQDRHDQSHSLNCAACRALYRCSARMPHCIATIVK